MWTVIFLLNPAFSSWNKRTHWAYINTFRVTVPVYFVANQSRKCLPQNCLLICSYSNSQLIVRTLREIGRSSCWDDESKQLVCVAHGVSESPSEIIDKYFSYPKQISKRTFSIIHCGIKNSTPTLASPYKYGAMKPPSPPRQGQHTHSTLFWSFFIFLREFFSVL